MTHDAPLSPQQEKIIRHLAKGFARRSLYPRSLEFDDYFQAGYLRAWDRRGSKGEAHDDLKAYVHARQAMVELDRREFRATRDYACSAINPRRKDYCAERDPGLADDVAAALRTLAPQERRAIVAEHWMGMSAAEAATAIGATKSTTHSYVRRGILKLRASSLVEDYEAWARKCPRRYKATIHNDRPNKRTKKGTLAES